MKNIILLVGASLILNSCGYMARAVVAPNNCKICQVMNAQNQQVWVEDECGGNVHNMEMRAKVAAVSYTHLTLPTTPYV